MYRSMENQKFINLRILKKNNFIIAIIIAAVITRLKFIIILADREDNTLHNNCNFYTTL